MSCLILRDSTNSISLQTCSQPTFIPAQYVMAAQDQTPSDYPLRWSGLSATIGQVGCPGHSGSSACCVAGCVWHFHSATLSLLCCRLCVAFSLCNPQLAVLQVVCGILTLQPDFTLQFCPVCNADWLKSLTGCAITV